MIVASNVRPLINGGVGGYSYGPPTQEALDRLSSIGAFWLRSADVSMEASSTQ